MDISALDLSQAFAQVIYFLVYQLGMALAAPLMLRSELYWVYLWSGVRSHQKVSSKPISAKTFGGTRPLKPIIGFI
jgi:hypothetical protein